MRRDIVFPSRGLNCRGWLYLPDNPPTGGGAPGQFPAVVMAHGMTCLKEHALPQMAEHFARAGIAGLVFDYRFFGASDGEPRNQVLALEQAEDYRNAISWLSGQPEIDPERIGIWGTSYSGGVALWVGTFDRRVKAVVAQNPSAMTPADRRDLNPEGWDKMHKSLVRDRLERYRNGTVRYIPVVSESAGACLLPGPGAYAGFMQVKAAAPHWQNQVSLESVEKIREFDPVSLIGMLAPTPLLLIAGELDEIIPLAAVRKTFALAGEPKELVVLPVTHFDFYSDPWLSRAAREAVRWYRKYL